MSLDRSNSLWRRRSNDDAEEGLPLARPDEDEKPRRRQRKPLVPSSRPSAPRGKVRAAVLILLLFGLLWMGERCERKGGVTFSCHAKQNGGLFWIGNMMVLRLFQAVGYPRATSMAALYADLEGRLFGTKLHPMSKVPRVCPRPAYETVGDRHPTTTVWPKICLATLTNEKKQSDLLRTYSRRDFDGLLEMGWQNRAQYAAKHGYHLFDESDLVDTNRAAGWSKIRAIQRLFREEACDWVYWLDADAVIMNSEKRLVDMLPSDPTLDLVLCQDNYFGGFAYNNGAFLIRNSPWASSFLQSWWNMTDFVYVGGLAINGDNAGMKAVIENLPDFEQHVVVPPRCTFNSFVKPSSTDEGSTTDMSEAYYHQGDFVAHLAGFDNKRDFMKLLLDLAR